MSRIDDASKDGKDQFNEKSNPQPEQQGIGSEQIRNTHPFPQPTPPGGGIREEVDRAAHQQKMQKDNDQSNKVNEQAVKAFEAANARKEQKTQQDLNKDKDGRDKNNDDKGR